jgi:hypothetical protein
MPQHPAGPCPHCEAMADRLGRMLPPLVEGQRSDLDAPELVREIDAAVGRLLSCPGPGLPGCVAFDGARTSEVALGRLATTPT